jgi:hypothetical protein
LIDDVCPCEPRSRAHVITLNHAALQIPELRGMLRDSRERHHHLGGRDHLLDRSMMAPLPRTKHCEWSGPPSHVMKLEKQWR